MTYDRVYKIDYDLYPNVNVALEVANIVSTCKNLIKIPCIHFYFHKNINSTTL